MKKLSQIFTVIIGLIFFSLQVYGDEKYEDKMTVAFDDPTKPGIIAVLYGEGDITVEGYNGKEVIIKTNEINHLSLSAES